MDNKVLELRSTLEELEAQLVHKKGIVSEMDNNGIDDFNWYKSLQSDVATLTAKVEYTQKNIYDLENASVEAKQEVGHLFDDFEYGDVKLSLFGLCAGEVEYKIVSDVFQQYVGDQAEKNAALVQSYKDEVNTLNETVDELSKLKSEIEHYAKINSDQADAIIRQDFVIDDLNAKRDAAALELDEARAEVARLKLDNENLRNNVQENKKTYGGSSLEDIKELAAEIDRKKPRIYNVRYVNEFKKTEYIANLAATDEEVTFPYYNLNGYKVLEGEELARFQEERQPIEVPEPIETVHEEVELQTPSIENAEVHTEPVSTMDGTVSSEAETVTRAEFEEVKLQLQEVRQRIGL